MNYSESLTKLMNQIFFHYKGLLVEKTATGFKWGEHTFKNIESLDSHLNNTYKSISNSLKK